MAKYRGLSRSLLSRKASSQLSLVESGKRKGNSSQSFVLHPLVGHATYSKSAPLCNILKSQAKAYDYHCSLVHHTTNMTNLSLSHITNMDSCRIFQWYPRLIKADLRYLQSKLPTLNPNSHTIHRHFRFLRVVIVRPFYHSFLSYCARHNSSTLHQKYGFSNWM